MRTLVATALGIRIVAAAPAVMADPPSDASAGAAPEAAPTAPTAPAAPVGNAEHDATPVRRPDATARTMFRGPFQSSRLFAMPTADTVGAYMLSLGGDGSLLQQPGVLTSAGVVAIGFGDIAQLEYRHTAAISVSGVDAPLPAVGVQLKLPLPARSGVPAIGIAFRLGLKRRETVAATTVDETVTDLFVVVRERFERARWLTLHAGLRVSPAEIVIAGNGVAAQTTQATLKLPTAGVELAMNPRAKLVAELAYAPRFVWAPGDPAASIRYGVLGRLGVRWSVLPAAVLDASFGYQLEPGSTRGVGDPRDVVQQWDIRLGGEVFVPWGALACRAMRVFCD